MAAQVVFRKGAAFCGDAAMNARAVPGILEAWAGHLGTLQAMRAMHAELRAVLQQQAGMRGQEAQSREMVRQAQSSCVLYASQAAMAACVCHAAPCWKS